MWCYQKPGFEALLIAELQKQQQCSQFCDTLLKAGGVSVPAHSCVLSAISPRMSSALSSTPLAPGGQTHFLEFRTLGACTLLHMVRLLYSGEMVGEGEKEKQEAISAAAKLGIHGLVEVTKRDGNSKNEEGEGQHMDVGVQTEPLMPQESEGRWARWRRVVTDGSTILWKETQSDGEKDKCVQTEELQVNTAPPNHPAAFLETNNALQGLGQMDSHLVPPLIPYIPMSLICPQDQSEMPDYFSAPATSMQDSTAARHTSVAVLAPPYSSVFSSFLRFPTQSSHCGADPQTWWTGLQGADRGVVADECEEERLAQFQGNIPGFINYFLNSNKEEGFRRGRAVRRQRAGVGIARRAGRGERRARRPRARTAGRGRGGLMQIVDVQDVGVSRVQKLFLQRGGVRASRLGQGGGAVGRNLYLTTRELLKAAKSCQRRRRGKIWEFNQSADELPFSEGGRGGGKKHRKRKNTMQQLHRRVPTVGRPRRARAKQPNSSLLSSPAKQLYKDNTISASSPSLQPSPCLSLLSPAASYKSPASPLLHTTSLPPPAPPPNDDQPEHIERLLEEVMMGLDILTNKDVASHSQLPYPKSSSCASASSGNNLLQNKEGQTTDLLEAHPNFHGSTQVGIVANSKVSNLQHQGEGELDKILDHFLQTFEQHIDSCRTREEEEMGGENSTKNTERPQPVRCSQTTGWQQSDKAATQQSFSQPHKDPAPHAVPPKNTEEASQKARAPTRRQKKRQKSHYMFSLERKKKPTDPKPRIHPDRGPKQLQQIPVVKLVRIPVKLQGCSQTVKVKTPAKTKTSSSLVNYPCGNLSDKNQPACCGRKVYPIRSRLKQAHIMDSLFEGTPLLNRPAGGRQGRPKKNCQLSTNGESLTPQIQPQPVEPCGMEEQLENNYEKPEEEGIVQPQEATEGPTRRGKKRGAESDEESTNDAEVKKVRFEQVAQLTTLTHVQSSECADCVSEAATVDVEDGINVETFSLTSAGVGWQREEDDKKLVWNEVTIGETNGVLVDDKMDGGINEMINVDGDSDEIIDLEKDRDNSRDCEEKGCCQSRAPGVSPSSLVSPEAKGGSLGPTGSGEDEDIDVIGGSSPLPDPVIISWKASSEGEEDEEDEDIDVTGENTGYTLPAVFTASSEGELVNANYQNEMLSC
ncbi:hypothetical protein Q8A73_010836 [Channa argus]|nr:hypothetical protein Q8A73_010836 [Channa argus]